MLDVSCKLSSATSRQPIYLKLTAFLLEAEGMAGANKKRLLMNRSLFKENAGAFLTIIAIKWNLNSVSERFF